MAEDVIGGKKRLFAARMDLLIETVLISAVVIIALIVRLVFVFYMKHPPLVADASNYDIMARQFLDKGFLGYMSVKPNAYITPGYPLFLSLIYLIFGYKASSPVLQVRIIQSMLGALTCLVMYLTGKRLKNKTVGIITAAAYAVYPTFVWGPSLILTEVVYSFFFVLYIYLLVIVFATGSRILSFFCGIVFAVSVLIRPIMFPLFLIPFIYQYFGTGRNRIVLKVFAFAFAGLILTMMPWWIRNIVTLHKPIILATQTGNPLIGGAFPYYENIDYSRYQTKDQVREGLKLIIEGFKARPLLYLKWFTIGKFSFIYRYMWFYPAEGFTFISSFWPVHYLAVTLGWVGAAFSIMKKRLQLISIFAIALTALQMLFIPEARYAYSIIPLLMILMAYILDYLLFRSRESS